MEVVINSYGSSLKRDNYGLVVCAEEEQRRLPSEGVTSIQIGCGTQLTSDAILLAIEKEIDLLFADKYGHPIGRIWSHKYGSISTIRKGQLIFSASAESVNWIVKVISNKISDQQGLIRHFMKIFKEEKMAKRAISRLEACRKKVLQLQGNNVNEIAATLRGLEGLASKVYFEMLNVFLPECLRFDRRSQHPALDPLNAMLNYGYGVLYGKVEGALIKAGIDPYVGVMHRDNFNNPVLVYDVIELYRTWIDHVVFSVATQGVVTDEYFCRQDDGCCWMGELGRRVLLQSINDYLEEVVMHNGMMRSRITQIQLYAHNLAQKFKGFS